MNHRLLSLLTRHTFVLLLAAMLAGACSQKQDKAATCPPSRGLPYELVLLIPRGLWTGELRDTLEAILLASTPGLPQHEPMFRLDVVYPDGHLSTGGFSGSHIAAWRTFRLRMLVDTAATEQLGVARDAIARPQVELIATAPTPHDLAAMLSRERERIVDIFVDAELEREAAALRHRHSQYTADSLRPLNRTVCVPPQLKASKRGQDFLWTGTNLNDRDQNFLYYTYPWDGRELTMDAFVAKRDSVLQRNIPGSLAGQWMQTARIDGRPLTLTRTRTYNNLRILEVRGLWELRAGALGGPFVAWAHTDTAARRVEVAEGFVYSPHSPKRPLIRQMEAALRTFGKLTPGN